MICPNCNHEVLEGSNTCTNCGAPFEEKTKGSTAPYAAFGRRAAASLVDIAIQLIVISVLLRTFFPDAGTGTFRLWGFLIGLAYKAGMECSSYQGTIGKILLKIKVVNQHGERISFLRSLGRFFASYLSNVAFGIGYLLPLFTKKKQTLHDLIASTYVYKK